MTPLLDLRDISKTFHLHHQGKTIPACRNITLALQPGEFVGITGRSGSGKSTILKLIHRTYEPQEGQAWYESEALGRVDLFRLDLRSVVELRRREIGYVSQFLSALPRTTALSLVEQAVMDQDRVPGTPLPEELITRAREKAREMLDHFQLSPELWETYPQTFSGGEKLRLNLARAMAKEPRLLLLDEPTASLDQGSKERVRLLLERLKARGTTILGIFHDLEFMEGLCDREFNMQAGRMVEASL